MRNSKVARFLLWVILGIALLPAVLHFFIPTLPQWLIWIGIVYAASCAALLIPQNDRTDQFIRQVESRKHLLPIVVATPYLLHEMIKGFPGWIIWAAIALVFPCLLLINAREDKKTV